MRKINNDFSDRRLKPTTFSLLHLDPTAAEEGAVVIGMANRPKIKITNRSRL